MGFGLITIGYYGFSFGFSAPVVFIAICWFAGSMALFRWKKIAKLPSKLSIENPEKESLKEADKLKKEQAKTPLPEKELTTKEILFKYVLKNKYIWLLAFAYFFVYVIRTSINDWGNFFLLESKGHSLLAANSSIFWFEAGGFCGSLAAGWGSDKFFSGRRGPVNVIYCLGVIFGLALLWAIPGASLIFSFIAMFVVGFLIFGPQMLIGVAAAELSHKKAAGTATGFAGWFGYLGAACGAYPIGVITQHYGWYGFFVALGICGIMSVILLLPLWAASTESEAAMSAES